MILIVEIVDNVIVSLKGLFDTCQTALEQLNTIRRQFNEDNIVAADDNYFIVEDEYGCLITYQIFQYEKTS